MVTRGFPLAVVRTGGHRALSRRAVPPAAPPARSEHLLQWGWAAVLPAKGSCSFWGGSRRRNLPWIQPWHSWDPGTYSIHALDGGCPAGVPLWAVSHSSSSSRPLRAAPPELTEPCSAPPGAEQGRGHAQSGAQSPELSAGTRRRGWRWGRALQRASRACLMWQKLISIAV